MEITRIPRISVRKNTGASDVGRRRRFNFIEGSNITLTTADDPTNDEIDITIAAASGGITNSAGANVIPKSDGTNIVASNLSDDGTTITIASGKVLAPAADNNSDFGDTTNQWRNNYLTGNLYDYAGGTAPTRGSALAGRFLYCGEGADNNAALVLEQTSVANSQYEILATAAGDLQIRHNATIAGDFWHVANQWEFGVAIGFNQDMSSAVTGGQALFIRVGGSICLNPTSGVTAATDGLVWQNSDQNTFELYIHSLVNKINTTLGTNSGAVTVGNTVTETSLLSATKTLTANYLKAGKTLRIIIEGYFSTKATPVDTITLKVKFGSTELITTGALTFAQNLSNVFFKLEALISCYTVGASGTVRSQALLVSGDTSALANTVISVVNTADAVINTTATQVVNVTATWSAADVASTITCTNSAIEILN